MTGLQKARRAEHEKYHRAYALNPNYRMGRKRMLDAQADVRAIPTRGSYLDVSCGRGEMLRFAAAAGFSPVQGTEIVPELVNGKSVVYAEVHALPFADKSFDVVSMFDVIEHLVPGDDRAACEEMSRVACRHIVVTANNRPSFNKAGDDLHINKRPYDEWDRLFREWFAGWNVTWITGKRHYVSEAWRMDLL